jgi:hypothetical protein
MFARHAESVAGFQFIKANLVARATRASPRTPHYGPDRLPLPSGRCGSLMVLHYASSRKRWRNPGKVVGFDPGRDCEGKSWRLHRRSTPAQRSQSRKPRGVRRVLDRLPVQIRRPIGPPHGTALAELSFDDVDRCAAAVSFLKSLDDRTALHAAISSRTSADRTRRQTRIGQPPKFGADDEIPSVGRHGMLEVGHQMKGLPPVTAMVVPEV